MALLSPVLSLPILSSRAWAVNVGTEAELRGAIFAANGGGDSNINVTANITLTQSLPMITSSVTVTGNGNTIDANNAGRVFFVQAGTAAISNLTINNAVAQGGAGGTGGAGGGLGAGAAVFVNSGATASLTNVAVGNASATGGAGGAANGGGRGGGGGGGGGGYAGAGAGAGGLGSGGGGGGGGEFGAGGASTSVGGGGGGGQQGNGGSTSNAGGGGGGGAALGANGGSTSSSTGGAGGGAQGGAGGDLAAPGGAGSAGGGGGGGGVSNGTIATTGGAGGFSGGGGGGGGSAGGPADIGGAGGTGGGGGGGGLGRGGDAGDFGGGGGSANTNSRGGSGGFGGGGGGGGNTTGGSTGGTGGFGAGGGSGSTAGGSTGGLGGQGGTGAGAGGGGAGLGGAFFVRSGGSLTINDGSLAGTYSATGGSTSGTGGATAGQAQGTVTYLQGTGTTTFNIGSGTQTMAGNDALAGSGSLAKSGAGTLALTGGNANYTGAVSATGGLIRFATGGLGSGTITLNGGGLQWGTGNTSDISSRLQPLGASGGTFDTNSNNVTLGSAVTGTGGVTKTGAGTLTLGAANSYQGGTTVTGGLINFNAANNFGSGTITLNGGGLQWATGNTTDISGNLAAIGAGGGTFDTNGNNVTLGTAITGTGGLTTAGAGTLSLTAANTYGGGTTINAGTLQIGNGGTTGSITGDVNAASGSMFQFNRSDTVTFGGQISGAGAVVQNGSGTLILTGANTYTGPTTVSAGTLSIASGSVLGGTNNTGIVLNGGTLLGTANLSLDQLNLQYANNATSTLAAAAGTTLSLDSNFIVGTGSTAIFGSATATGVVSLNMTSATGGAYNIVVAGGTLSGTNAILGFVLGQADQVTINSGATLGLSGSATIQDLQGGGTVDLGANRLTVQAGSFGGAITGTGDLTKSTVGTFVLSGSNTYSGTTTVSLGILRAGAANSLASGSAHTVATGAILDLNNFNQTVGSLAGAGNVMLGTATLTAGGDNSNTAFSGVLSGVVGRLTKTGTGTMTLTGANTYDGTTTISGGTLEVGNGGTTGTLGTGAVTNNATLQFNRSNALTVSNAISGTGAVIQQGTGTTTLTGTNNYAGGTTVNAGTLQAGAANTFSTGSAHTVAAGATLALNSFNQTIGSLAGAGSATLGSATLTAGGNDTTTTFSGGISGTGGLIKTGTGTMTLSGANAYTGTTAVNVGRLQIGAGGTAGSIAGDVSVATGAELAFNRSDTITYGGQISGAGAVLQNGSGTLILTGTNSYGGGTTVSGGVLTGTTSSLQGAITNNALVSFDQSTTGTYAGTMSGSGGLIKDGSGDVTVSGVNTYSGGTTVNAGTLRLGAGASLGSIGGLAVNASGTFDLNGNNQAVGTLLGAGAVALGSATLTVGSNNDSTTFSGVISGTGGFVKQGTGNQTLSGANNYTGGTTVSGGTLTGNSTSLQGAITNNAAVVFDQATTGTYAGNMSGTGSLTKSGAGLLSLSGINTYAGATTVNAGTLAVNGSIVSGVAVNNGGTLGGTGTVGSTTINSGGTVAPGNSIGTLTVNGSFTQSAGSIYQVEVNAAGQSDRINVTGAPGTATINGGTVQVLAQAGTYARNTTYTILSATGGRTGTYSNVTSNFAFLTPSLSYDANNVYLLLLQGSSAFAAGAQTGNQRAVGNALDQANATATGDFATVLNALSSLNTQQGPAALNAISGQQYSGFGSANVVGGVMFMNVLGQQMNQARGGSGAGTRVALAEACDVACDGASPSPWSLWGSALGATGSVAGNNNSATLTYNAGGVSTGVDYRFSPNLLAGAGFGYSSGNQWASGLNGRATTDSYSFSLYSSFTQSAFYLDALAGYAYNDNQMTRTIVIPGLTPRTAMGRTGANQFLGQAEAGYRFGIYEPAAASITPFARFQAMTVTQNAFSESGANSLNLNVAQQTTNSVRTVLGAELAGGIDMGWRERLALQFRLGWAHEYADTSRPVTASFAGAPTIGYTVFGASPVRNTATVGLAASTAVADATSIYLRYDGEFGTGSDNHVLSAGFRMSW